MRTLLLVVLILSAGSIQAQHFSAGIRTGVGLWKGEAFDNELSEYKTKRTTLWEKEAFMRYETGQHFAFEVGINEVEGQRDGIIYGICGVGLPQNYSYIENTKILDKYYSLNLRVQYGLSCPFIKGLANYPGIVAAPTLNYTETTDNIYHSSTQDYTSDVRTNKEVVIQYGMEDMVRYQVSKHIDVHTIIACRFNNNGSLLKHAFTAQAGIAYRF